MFKNLLPLLFFLVFNSIVYSQIDKSVQAHNSLAEKIYLQFDKDMYRNDETMWFKAIVSNVTDHSISVLSGVLYVDLIDSEENILQSQLIKIEKGVGQGSITLDKKYIQGMYQVHAYTEWNKNFNTDFNFKKYVHVYSRKNYNDEKPYKNITLTKKESGKRELSFLINPIPVDSLHHKNLAVFVVGENVKDTIVLKKNNEGLYNFRYELLKGLKQVEVKFMTQNRKQYSKAISLNKDFVDIQFFPESGSLVKDLTSKVAFKAINVNGKGKKVKGEIVDSRGEVLTSFESNELGMGSFLLKKVSDEKQYYARLNKKNRENDISPQIFSLPKVSDIGNVFSVKKGGNKIQLTFASNYMKSIPIFLEITTRGYLLKLLDVTTEKGSYNWVISPGILPEGIIAFRILDASKNPILERLYFNQKEDRRVSVRVTTDKEIYKEREKTNVKIKTSFPIDSSKQLSASLLVVNQDELGTLHHYRENILTYFLLSSDLKGTIEKPGFYFTKGTAEDVDALMLTQGWSQYNYVDKVRKIIYQPEFNLTVRGFANSKKSKKEKKEVELLLLPVNGGNKTIAYTTKAIIPGKFEFKLGNLYGDYANVLIQEIDKKEKKNSKYVFSISKRKFPSFSFDNNVLKQDTDSISSSIIEKSVKRKVIEENYLLSTKGRVALNEVVVKNTKRILKRKEVVEKYGIPDYVITKEEIKEKEKPYSSGLYSILRMSFADKVNVSRNIRTGRLRASAIGGYPSFFLVDGIVVHRDQFDLLEFISPDEVIHFEVIERADIKWFKDLVIKTYNTIPRVNSPYNIIAIYTRSGKGLLSALSVKKGIETKSIPVFSLSKEYYSPKYDYELTEEDKAVPDLRTLVQWIPNLRFDELGNISADFYNSDVDGKYLVIIEVISSTGEIGYQQTTYEVEKN